MSFERWNIFVTETLKELEARKKRETAIILPESAADFCPDLEEPDEKTTEGATENDIKENL